MAGAERELAGFVRSLRRATGLSQEDVAGRAGLSVRTVNNIENGRIGRPQRMTLELLATVLAAAPDQREHLLLLADGGTGPTDPVSPPPAQLPPAHARYVGRRRELSVALDALRSASTTQIRPVVVLVHGQAGVGKTALALHAAHAVADHFPDGVLHVALGGASRTPAQPEPVLTELCRALGAPAAAVPARPEQRAAYYRSLLAGRRVLVFCDDARDAAQVEPLLPGTGGCAVIVTSRWALLLPTAGVDLPLDVMGDDDALDLLAAGVGPRITDAPDAARAIVSACGGLPLALWITAGRLALHPSWSLPDFAETLTGSRNRLDHLRLGDASVRASFEETYQAAGATAQRMFDRFAVHGGPFLTLDALAYLAETTLDEAEQVLETLCQAHLVTSSAVGRYAMHDLLRDHGRTHLDAPATRHAVGRLLDHVVDAVERRWCEAERSNVLAVAAAAAPTEPPLADGLLRLLEAAGGHLDRDHDEHGWRILAEAVLRAGTAAGRTDVQAAAHSDLCAIGRTAMYLDDAEEHGRRSLALFHAAGVTGPALSRAWNRLGTVHTVQERYDDAARCYSASLALRREAGDLLGEASVLNNLGQVQMAQGDHAAAEASYRQARSGYRRVGDTWGEAMALLNTGDLYIAHGRFRAALAAHRRALALAERSSARSTVNFALCGLADAALGAGHPRWAFDLYERCLAGLTTSVDQRLLDAARAGRSAAQRRLA